MSRRSTLLAAVGLLAIATACTPEAPTTTVAAEGDGRAAAEVVEELIRAVTTGDYAAAAAFTITEQMAWVVMAEGGSLAQAGSLSDDDLTEVAVNYWKGFAETAQLPSIEVGVAQESEISGVRFAVVPVNANLRLVMRDDGGWRVDIIASFAPSLANRLIEAAEVVEANRGGQGGGLREILSDQRPSVEIAARQPGLAEATRTELADLLEVLADLE
ncbi:MAG: hypothetical protein Q8Q52_01815, partial [Acidimicrobiia bacterium]|nr:hypothetical protein [Acidimicrobiia bacterium]